MITFLIIWSILGLIAFGSLAVVGVKAESRKGLFIMAAFMGPGVWLLLLVLQVKYWVTGGI